MKKLIILMTTVITGFNVHSQTQTQDLNMGLYQLQFPSASGGSNRIQSYAGSIQGSWLFKSRFDDMLFEAGENDSNKRNIIFSIGDTEKVRLNASGYFGIHTISPGAPLTIGYNNSTNQFAFERSDGIEAFFMNINSTNQILFKNTSGGGDYDIQSNVGGQGMKSVLFIEGSNGYVGIGTSDPQSKLAVDGQIRATGVKVLANITVPDYVFEEDYELLTLEKTKEYISKNKHLPEIPSAAEIGENGIDLGDMNMRLLKKIEELTLYLIEQNKQNQAQQVRIEQLEEKISQLEK